MEALIKKFLLCTLLTITAITLFGQGETKEKFSLPIEFGQGFYQASTKQYVASLSIVPMLGFQVKQMNKIRVGPVLNGFYSSEVQSVSLGARFAYRLNNSTGVFGNTYNIWLFTEASWSNDLKLYGGGFTLALNPIEISVHPQYESSNGQFWFTSKLGLNLAALFGKVDNDPIN